MVKMRAHYHFQKFTLLNHFHFHLYGWIFRLQFMYFKYLEEENCCIHNNYFFIGKNSPFFLEYFFLVLFVAYKY